jgi:RHS repeat-associated protein
MKKIFFLIYILYSVNLLSQSNHATWILQDFDNESVELQEELDLFKYGILSSYIGRARDAVVMKPGFKYSPNKTESTFKTILDPAIVIPASNHYAEFSSIDFSAFDNSLPVGTIQGNFNVTPTGAATYSMKIEVPQGIQGLQPNLAVTYNSMGGMSNMGKGFTLSGISAITRTNQVPYFDDKWEAIDFINDKFALDGQRLFVVNGEYGENHAQYRTESYSPMIVTSKYSLGLGSNNPEYFIVETNEGQTLTYGKGRLSLHKFAGTGYSSDEVPAYMWLLSEVKDKNDNKMLYHYHARGGEHYIQKIEYINSGSNYLGEVIFVHEEHDHPQKQYVGKGDITGYVKQSLLLKEIIIKLNGKIYRKYIFDYFEDILPKLYQATVYDGKNNSLNSTKFEWAGTIENELTVDVSEVTFDNSILKDELSKNNDTFKSEKSSLGTYIPWDYTGDSRTDMVVANYRRFNVYLNYQNRFIDRGFVRLNHTIESSFTSPLICDFNGDDIDDLLFVNFVSKNGYIGDYYFSFVKRMPTGTYDNVILEEENAVRNGGWKWNYQKIYCNTLGEDYKPLFLTGDFVGNGKNQICFGFNGQFHFFEYDEDNLIVKKSAIESALSSYHKDNIRPFIADFNGDGKADFFRCNSNGLVKIFTFDEPLRNVVPITSFQWSDYNTKPKVKLVDFNGDGSTDLCYYDKSTSRWKYGIWNGNGFNFDDLPILTNNIDPDSDDHEVFFADFNRDGIADILHAEKSTSKSDEFTSTLNFYFCDNSMNFKHVSRTENVDINNFISGYIDERDTPADIDGDGYYDILSYDELDAPVDLIMISTSEDSDPNTVKTITDGMNNKIDLLYKPGIEMFDCEEDPYKPDIFPIRKRPGAVVFQSIASDGTTEYEYSTLYYHKFGKGLVGAKTFNSTNNNTNHNASYTYDINSEYFVSYLKSKSSSFEGYEAYDYTFENRGKRQFFQKLDSKIKTDINAASGYKTIYGYDHLDRVKDIKTEVWDYPESKEVGMTSFTYNESDDFLDNRIKKVNTIISYGADNKTYKIDYRYDPNGNLINELITYSEGRILEKRFSEYVAGNPGTIITSGTNMDHVQTEKFDYDNSLRFAIKRILPNNDIVTCAYDPYTDLKISSTDAAGHKITMKYGAFGELLEETDSHGNTIQYTTSFSTEHGSAYKKTMNPTGAGMTTEFFNQRGQSILEKSPGSQGVIQTKREYYESGTQYGKLKYLYEPSYVSPNLIAEEYSYDGKRQIDYIVRKGDNQLITDYDINAHRRTTKITQPNGLFQTKVYNIWGGIESITDNGGTINYSDYSALGDPKSISYSGNTWEFQYDDQGNRTSLIDPDAGQRHFEYDVLGNIKQKELPSGTIITYYYDNINRLEKESSTAENEGDILYTYIQTGNGKGKVEKIEGYNQIEYNLTYNDEDKLETKSFAIKGLNLDINFKYDYLGRVSSKTLPDGTKIAYSYDDSDGSIKEIYVNDTAVAKNIMYDAKDRVTSMNMGEQLSFSQDFNMYDYPIFRKIETDGVPLFYQSYIFDEKENWLVSRKDEILGNFETFGYDSQKRLISSTVNGLLQLDMSYFSNGNINSKNDVGTYQYENNNHAVTKIDPLAQSYFENLSGESNSGSLLVQDVAYNSFNKPVHIEAGEYIMDIEYGPDKYRRHFILTKNGTKVWERYYADDYIYDWRNGQERHIVVVGGPDGLLGLNITENGESQFYYAATDYMGSILALITSNGSVVEEYNYDAWGRRRNVDTWTYGSVETPTLTRIGYTGHEHWDELQLINMTGRMYDARIARFLNTDPYVQTPDNTQNLNRYTYALNNPLIYDDPDGQFWQFIVVGAVIGAYYGGMIASENHNPFDKQFWEDGWKGAVTGAIVGAAIGALVATGVGAAGTGIHGVISGNTLATSNFAWQVTSNAVYTGALNVITSGFKTGGNLDAMLASGLYGLATGVAASYIAKGIEANSFISAYTKGGLWNANKAGWLTRDIVNAGLNGFGTTIIEHYYVYGQKDVGELLKAGTLSAVNSMLFVGATSGLTKSTIKGAQARAARNNLRVLSNHAKRNLRYLEQQLTFMGSAVYSSGLGRERTMKNMKEELVFKTLSFN